MNPIRRVLLVCYYTYPAADVGARRVSELANHLVRENILVSVLAGPVDLYRTTQELDARIRVKRVNWSRGLGDRLLAASRKIREWTRAAASGPAQFPADSLEQAPAHTHALRQFYREFAHCLDPKKWWSCKVAACTVVAILSDRPTVVVTSAPPWSNVVLVSFVCRVMAVPCIADFRDPLSDRNELVPDRSRWVRKVEELAERYVVRAASRVVTTSESLTTRLRERYPRDAGKVSTIRNGFERHMARSDVPPLGRLSLLHAGTVYLKRNPMPLLDGLARLVKDPDIDRTRVRLTFAGDCTHWQGVALASVAERLGICDVFEIAGTLTPEQVTEIIGQSNVLVTLAQGYPLQLPAKLLEQLASNRDVMLFAEPRSEAALVGLEWPHLRLLGDDVDEVHRVLRELYRRWTAPTHPALVEADFDTLSRSRRNTEYLDLVRDLASKQ